jgi:hypothetical protein
MGRGAPERAPEASPVYDGIRQILDSSVDRCAQFRIQIAMGRWKRFGVIVVRYSMDHDPPHVHVFEDGKRTLKFDIEAWRAMEGKMTPRARRALEALREEGVLGEKPKI